MYHRLLLLTLIINIAEMYRSCAPGEVATLYTFTCIFSKNESYIYWKKNAELIFACQDSTCIASARENSNIYEATRSSQSTTLKINAVTTQSGGDYSCYNDKDQIFLMCSLRVYAKPNMVTCQDPELQTEKNEVAVVCTVLGVYPNPICQFSWFIDNTERRIIQKSSVEYNNLTGSMDPSYFNQNCSFKVSARNFTRGKHQFQLLAYPNVTGKDSDTVYGKHSTQTSPKYVADPNVTLECSETNVQEGKQFSCTCKETANTFILPNTTLFYGAATISSALQQVTVNITAKRNTSELICQVQLLDGTKANKTQTKQVYYPVKPGSPALDVGAIVGGIVAAVVVIMLIVVIVYLVKKKGSHQVLEALPEAQAPENPHYEEIIDFRSDMPGNPVYYANQILSIARDEEVEYANIVSGL